MEPSYLYDQLYGNWSYRYNGSVVTGHTGMMFPRGGGGGGGGLLHLYDWLPWSHHQLYYSNVQTFSMLFPGKCIQVDYLCGTRELWYFGEGYVVAGALSDHFLSEQSFLNVMEFEQMTVFCEIQHSELCSCSGHP